MDVAYTTKIWLYGADVDKSIQFDAEASYFTDTFTDTFGGKRRFVATQSYWLAASNDPDWDPVPAWRKTPASILAKEADGIRTFCTENDIRLCSSIGFYNIETSGIGAYNEKHAQ